MVKLKILKVFSLVILLCTACNPAHHPETGNQGAGKNLRLDFSWLPGKWERMEDGIYSAEFWKAENDTLLRGIGVVIKNQDTLFKELIHLTYTGGNVYYIPEVSGQNNGRAVVFQMASLKNDTVIFENKAHDFPQRIIYSHPHKDSLVAWIEGNDKGKFRREFFRFCKK